jgi:hypothetical protein
MNTTEPLLKCREHNSSGKITLCKGSREECGGELENWPHTHRHTDGMTSKQALIWNMGDPIGATQPGTAARRSILLKVSGSKTKREV